MIVSADKGPSRWLQVQHMVSMIAGTREAKVRNVIRIKLAQTNFESSMCDDSSQYNTFSVPVQNQWLDLLVPANIILALFAVSQDTKASLMFTY